MKIKLSLAAIFMIGIYACLSSTDARAALTDGLVAYYPLEDGSGLTAADAVGVNNGTLNGNFTGSEWTTGKIGGALQFTRTANLGSFPGTHAGFIEANSLLSNGVLNNSDSYTFSSWVKWAPQQSGSVNFGYAIWGANTAVNANGNVMRVGLDNNADGITARAINGLAGITTDFSDQQWHLLTLTFGTDGNADIYFDGDLAISKADDTGLEREQLFSTATLFHFGMEMEANQTTDPFSGTLDELAIWNRELSAQEISDLFNNGDGVSLLAPVEPSNIPEPSTIFMWSVIGIAMFGCATRRRRRR